METWFYSALAWYLGLCARPVIKRASKETPIIGITGSSGKTSTKEVFGALIREKYGKDALVAPGNLNNEIGLPLAILGFSQTPSFWQYAAIKVQAFGRALAKEPAKAYVLEYGIDHPGDMDFLISVARPTVAVLTNITSVHLEYFKSLQELVKEKTKLAKSVKDGLVIINGDDKELVGATKNIEQKVLTFGCSRNCDLKLVDFALKDGLTEFSVIWEDKTEKYTIKALGEQHIMSAMPVIIYAKVNGYTSEHIKTALLKYIPLPGRGNIIAGKKDSVIINESYNANPLSTQKALEVLGKMKGSTKVAVLGDMLELGSQSKNEHERIMRLAKRYADKVIAVGPRMSQAGNARPPARQADKEFDSPLEAAEYLEQNLEPKSIILVKGSQGARTEKIIEKIMAHPDLREKLLPRQNRTWRNTPVKPF